MKEIIFKPDDKYYAICQKCGTIFSYTDEDTEDVKASDVGDMKVKSLVRCPNCDHSIVNGDWRQIDKVLKKLSVKI